MEITEWACCQQIWFWLMGLEDGDPQKMGGDVSGPGWWVRRCCSLEDEVHWIWFWLMDPEGDALDLVLASGPEDAAPQKMHVLDLVKTKEKIPKAHAWDRTQNNELLTSFFWPTALDVNLLA